MRIGEERGDSSVVEPLFYSCYLELLAEDWRRGVELAERLYEPGVETERDDMVLYGLGARAVLLAHLGDEAGRAATPARCSRSTSGPGSTHGRSSPAFALGVLELSLDRPGEALPLLRRVREIDLAEGVEEPAMRFAFPVHAEAAIAVGELGEAEELLDWIEERAVRLDREWALACAARCRGLLAARARRRGGCGRGVRARARRARARPAPALRPRADAARAGRGAAPVQAQGAAREAIEAAIAIFDELGAALWSAKARRELARISGRRSAEGLTETERRVAELVAAGRSNKEVASELHVTGGRSRPT